MTKIREFITWGVTVLIVEVIDLNIWIFTLAPRWVPTVVVCDNNLE
jgi:hypothetical protein